MPSDGYPRGYARCVGYGFALVVAALAIGIRVWWAHSVTPRPISDAGWYWKQAVSIAAGRGYRGGELLTAYRPVGYSAALAPFVWYFGDDVAVARLFNASVSTLTFLSLFVLTRRLTGSLIAAVFAMAVFGAYPADIGYTSLALSEPFFNALSLAAVALFISHPQALWSAALVGSLIALATLTRPQGIVLLPILTVVLLAFKSYAPRARRCAFAMCVALILTMAPWWVRNAQAFHAFVPVSTNGGMNFLIGNNAQATGCYGLSSELKQQLETREARDSLTEVQYDNYAAQLGFDFIRHNPMLAVALWPRKFACLFHDEGAFAHFSRKIPPEQRPLLNKLLALCQVYYRGLLWLAGGGFLLASIEVIISRRARRRLLWLPSAIILGFVVVTLIAFGDPRFHHPIMSWAAIYAGYGLNQPLRALQALLAQSLQLIRSSILASPRA